MPATERDAIERRHSPRHQTANGVRTLTKRVPNAG